MKNTLHSTLLKLNLINIKKFSFLFTILFLTTSISFSQNQNSNVDGGVISTSDDTTVCLNGSSGLIDVTLADASGRLSQWIITDESNTILSLPDNPPFDFSNAGTGVCRIWHLSYNGIPPFSHIQNLADLRGRFDLSNYITVTRVAAEGGTLTGGPFEFTVGDGIADMIPEGAITLAGDSGANSQWVITDSEGTILGLPESPYMVNFDGAGTGTCLVWHLSYADGLEGVQVGNNAADLMGCYDLSNPIEVIRTEITSDPVDGGTLTGGPFTFCVGDGVADMISEGAITLTGNTGANSQWVVTDSDGNILGLPASPYDVDFDGAEAGTCLIWHLSYEDGLLGAAVGNNASELVGTYDLSNPLSVTRNQPEGGTLTGGPFTFTVGDGNADFIPNGSITRTGTAGEGRRWVIADENGVIVALPVNIYQYDFEETGSGIYYIVNVSYYQPISGYRIGNTVANVRGCFDISNPISVTKTEVGGRLSIYPNPASSVLNVDLRNRDVRNASISIYNMQNVEVYSSRLSNTNSENESSTIDISRFQEGVYVLSVTTENGQKMVQKFVIK